MFFFILPVCSPNVNSILPISSLCHLTICSLCHNIFIRDRDFLKKGVGVGSTDNQYEQSCHIYQ